MVRATIRALMPLGLVLGTFAASAPAHAKDNLTVQDPASAQPSLPKSMPNLTIPGAGSGDVPKAPKPKPGQATKHASNHHHHRRYSRRYSEPLERPVLANVELVEGLPHPPQPPHVTVPVPAYPLDNFVTYFTAPPPPVVCRPTRYDRFKPDPHLVDENPVLCTADNP